MCSEYFKFDLHFWSTPNFSILQKNENHKMKIKLWNVCFNSIKWNRGHKEFHKKKKCFCFAFIHTIQHPFNIRRHFSLTEIYYKIICRQKCKPKIYDFILPIWHLSTINNILKIQHQKYNVFVLKYVAMRNSILKMCLYTKYGYLQSRQFFFLSFLNSIWFYAQTKEDMCTRSINFVSETIKLRWQFNDYGKIHMKINVLLLLFLNQRNKL